MCRSRCPVYHSGLSSTRTREVIASLDTHSGIGRAADARSVVDAAECRGVLCALPVLEAVDTLVADVPDAKILEFIEVNLLLTWSSISATLTVNPSVPF